MKGNCMNRDFWIQKWEKNEIGFHQSTPNPLLVTYFNELNLVKGSRVFLPLCGKTLDIDWLLSKGFKVTGVELSELAIEQLFKELGVEPEIIECGNTSCYRATNIDVFVGDIFTYPVTFLARLMQFMTGQLWSLCPKKRARDILHIY